MSRIEIVLFRVNNRGRHGRGRKRPRPCLPRLFTHTRTVCVATCTRCTLLREHWSMMPGASHAACCVMCLTSSQMRIEKINIFNSDWNLKKTAIRDSVAHSMRHLLDRNEANVAYSAVAATPPDSSTVLRQCVLCCEDYARLGHLCNIKKNNILYSTFSTKIYIFTYNFFLFNVTKNHLFGRNAEDEAGAIEHLWALKNHIGKPMSCTFVSIRDAFSHRPCTKCLFADWWNRPKASAAAATENPSRVSK